MDPMSLGRVKVRFPWLSEEYVSAWARTVQIGASEAGGFLWLPEVGDEVLVAFDRGEMDYPYVIGNLYNGVARPIPEPEVDGVVASRRITSRALSELRFDDGPQAMGLTLQTAEGTFMLKFDVEEATLTVSTQEGKIAIQSLQDISITSETGSITLEAPAGQVSVMATNGVQIEAASGEISMAAPSGISLEAATVSVESAEISLGA
jgi:uncharacterized protein involved in type VI secretion and phage assembly